MTDEEKQAAEAYIKLHENVEKLILSVIHKELADNVYGAFNGRLRALMLGVLNDELKNIKLGRAGQTLPY